MNSIIYEDKPPYDIRLRLIVILPVVIIFTTGFVMMDKEAEAANGLLIAALVIGIMLWAIIPRKYVVMNDRIAIILNSGIAISILMKQVTAVRMARGFTFSANFPTTLAGRYAVEVIRKKCISVVITPGDPEQFLKIVNDILSGQLPVQKGTK